MYIVALDLTKIYFVLNPIATFVYQIDITDSNSLKTALPVWIKLNNNV